MIFDLLILGLVMMFKVEYILNSYKWKYGKFECGFYIIMYLLVVLSFVINFCVVMVDCYLVLRLFFYYVFFMILRRVVFIICCVWMYVFFWVCLFFMGWRFYVFII